MLTKMASHILVFSLVIAFLLIFLSPSYVVSYLDVDGIKDSSSLNSEKVNLSVYYDALCLSCATFIVRNLETIFNNGLIDVINLRMVPWGNARVNNANNTIVCQHGPDECLLNTIQACAINVWNDVNKYYGLISCIEFAVARGQQQDWKMCFNSLGLPKKPVCDCYNNGNGTKLEISYGYETANLNPPFSFLPWVLVNNQPIGKGYENFTTYVCNAYKGSAAPNACKLPRPKISSIREANLIHAVCYGGEAKNLTPLRPIN